MLGVYAPLGMLPNISKKAHARCPMCLRFCCITPCCFFDHSSPSESNALFATVDLHAVFGCFEFVQQGVGVDHVKHQIKLGIGGDVQSIAAGVGKEN